MKTLTISDLVRIEANPKPKVYDTLGIAEDEYLSIIEKKKADKENWMGLEIKDILDRLGINTDIWIKHITAAVLKFKETGKDTNYTSLLSVILIKSGVNEISLEDFIGTIQLVNYTCLETNRISTEMLKSPLIRDLMVKMLRG